MKNCRGSLPSVIRGHKSRANTNAASKIIDASSAFRRIRCALSNDCSSPSTKHCENPSRFVMTHLLRKDADGKSRSLTTKARYCERNFRYLSAPSNLERYGVRAISTRDRHRYGPLVPGFRNGAHMQAK